MTSFEATIVGIGPCSGAPAGWRKPQNGSPLGIARTARVAATGCATGIVPGFAALLFLDQVDGDTVGTACLS